MKGAKVLFLFAGVFLLISICFLSAFLFLPENEKVYRPSVAEQTATDAESREENAQITEAAGAEENMAEDATEDLKAEAEVEIIRFKKSYGLEISFDEMVRQLKVRREYERMYGISYELENIFLITTDDTEGDAGACIEGDAEDTEMYEENIVAEKIRRYVLLYDVDEARYEGMTNYEKLLALEVEYGSLLDESELYEQTPDTKEERKEVSERWETEGKASAGADAEDEEEE